MVSKFDVVVLGGGPAGCATAIALRQLGHSCLVVERSNYTQARVGETLAPLVRRSLAALGLWDQFVDARHLRCVAIRSVWGAALPNARESIFDPYGGGWHLDRRRFDMWLAREAESVGAEVLREARLLSCETYKRGWNALIEHAGQHRVQTKFVVDATGRAASFARRHGARRAVLDRLIGVVGCYRPKTREPVDAGSLLVEAERMGWWYSAPLPNEQVVVAFMTDGDLHARACRQNGAQAFECALARATHASACVRGFSLESLQTMAAYGSRLSSICGPGWLAVGDAAATYDPLCGQGILKSLESGIRAASAISQYLKCGSATMREHEAKARADFDRYLQFRYAYYAQETRWRDSPFWRRRHSESRAAPEAIGKQPRPRQSDAPQPKAA